MISLKEAFAILNLPLTATKAQVKVGLQKLESKNKSYESAEAAHSLKEMKRLFKAYFELLTNARRIPSHQGVFFSNNEAARIAVFSEIEKRFANIPEKMNIFREHLQYVEDGKMEEATTFTPLSFDKLYKELDTFPISTASIEELKTISKLITEYLSFDHIDGIDNQYKWLALGILLATKFSNEFQLSTEFYEFIKELAWLWVCTIVEWAHNNKSLLQIPYTPEYVEFYNFFREMPNKEEAEGYTGILSSLMFLNGLYMLGINNESQIAYLLLAIDTLAVNWEPKYVLDYCSKDNLTSLIKAACKKLADHYQNQDELLSNFYAGYLYKDFEGMKIICRDIPCEKIDVLTNSLQTFKKLASSSDSATLDQINSCLEELLARAAQGLKL